VNARRSGLVAKWNKDIFERRGQRRAHVIAKLGAASILP
jgi:hypothetical protein